jgi:hypothetical protein
VTASVHRLVAAEGPGLVGAGCSPLEGMRAHRPANTWLLRVLAAPPKPMYAASLHALTPVAVVLCVAALCCLVSCCLLCHLLPPSPAQPKYEAYMKLFEPLCGPAPQRPILTEGANKVGSSTAGPVF